jgi:aspartate aminotransferase, cytoplasmic
MEVDKYFSVQTISGTGANHLGALFLSRFYPWNGEPTVYLSNPTWGKISCGAIYPMNSPNVGFLAFHLANHHAIFKNVGINPVDYPYYDPKTIGLDFTGFVSSLQSAVPGSVFLLHACAHNPTGVDPTPEQWDEIATVFLEKGHFAFFDCAYQGFASGDLDKDASAVRYFEQKGVPLLVCQVRRYLTFS